MSSDSRRTKRGSRSKFGKPVYPGRELAAVVGEGPLLRTEVTKKVWDYIRENRLQDPDNRRIIRADERLKPVFHGRKAVSMFELTRLINQHLHGDVTVDPP